VRPPGFEPGQRAREDEFRGNWDGIEEVNRKNNNEIDYRKVRKDFIKWMYERCTKEHTDKLVYYLDKYLNKPIASPRELFELLSSVKSGKRHFCMAVRDLLKFYETFDLISEESLARYRKVAKIPKTNHDDYIPDDSKVIGAFRKIEDNRYRLIFKLLALSGIRLRGAVYLFNTFDKDRLVINDKIARYPLSFDRKTKRSFYAYMPKNFALELERVSITESGVKSYLNRRGLPAKYLRKWNYNFLILNGVPESVADFIQGRASITVGSMHYLAKVKQADEWYSRVVDKLISVFILS
jgi:intergrase/recombinase